MTLLVSWVAIDSHGVSSAYIASDSRITWGDVASFDYGRKVFNFSNSPDILGYCGDVLFPSLVLGQIATMADSGILFAHNASCKERFEAIKEKLIQQFFNYPHMVDQITSPSIEVLHIARENRTGGPFSCWLMTWQRTKGWSGTEVTFPQRSNILKVLGSGRPEFNDNLERYQNGQDRETSRCIFQCFCDTLFNIKDKRCGGAPQLVGIYRKPKSPARPFGVITKGKRFFLGALVGKDVLYDAVEWRNDLFEICDGETMKREDGAQQQPDLLRRR